MTKRVVMMNGEGLDVSPLATLVQIANKFTCTVHIEIGTKKINAKSLMGMMTFNVNDGDEIAVVTEGVDEEVAANEIEAYLNGQA